MTYRDVRDLDEDVYLVARDLTIELLKPAD